MRAAADGRRAAGPSPQTTPTWAFDLPIAANGGRELRVAMVDSAYGTDKELTDWVDKQRVSYSEAAALTTPTPGRESWLLTHRPLFAVIADVNLPKDDPLADTWSSDGQMVASYGLLDNYSMILASHNHYLQATQIPGQPGALIMGNGGALLDPPGSTTSPRTARSPVPTVSRWSRGWRRTPTPPCCGRRSTTATESRGPEPNRAPGRSTSSASTAPPGRLRPG